MIDDRLFWEILGLYLPKNRDAKILDAGGGTGRKTLPLAKMGYKITLSDLSSGMLNIAKEKLRKENLLGKVKIIEADVADLPFQNESFDFVLCVGGPLSIADSSKAASELVRVLKKKGKIFVDATSRYYLVLQWFKRDPGSALSLAKKESFGAFSPKELRELFQRNGIKVIGIYGYGGGGPGGLGILDLLPGEIIKAKEWSDETFSQLMELMRYLNKEPSILGIAGSPILVGEKI
jgi:SAM-dependent methyltransferase